jgi:hypothetical protein
MMNELRIEKAYDIRHDLDGLWTRYQLGKATKEEVDLKFPVKWVSVESLIERLKKDSYDESGKGDLIMETRHLIKELTEADK